MRGTKGSITSQHTSATWKWIQTPLLCGRWSCRRVFDSQVKDWLHCHAEQCSNLLALEETDDGGNKYIWIGIYGNEASNRLPTWTSIKVTYFWYSCWRTSLHLWRQSVGSNQCISTRIYTQEEEPVGGLSLRLWGMCSLWMAHNIPSYVVEHFRPYDKTALRGEALALCQNVASPHLVWRQGQHWDAD